jgi:hypothetical protein
VKYHKCADHSPWREAEIRQMNFCKLLAPYFSQLMPGKDYFHNWVGTGEDSEPMYTWWRTITDPATFCLSYPRLSIAVRAVESLSQCFIICVPQRSGKAIPLQAWTGPEGSRRLRLSDFKTFGT